MTDTNTPVVPTEVEVTVDAANVAPEATPEVVVPTVEATPVVEGEVAPEAEAPVAEVTEPAA